MSEQFIWPTEMLPLEQELLELFHAIEQDNFRTLDLSATGYSDPRITGSFIRWLLLEVVVASPFAISALRLHNAVIAGVLDFSGKALPIAISFDNCVFNDDIDFTDAAVRMIEVSSCTLGRILADRVTTQGTFRIRRSRTTNSSLSSIKHLRRCGATIGGNLDLRGSLFGSLQADPAFPCIWADGAKVAGNTLLTDGFTSRGEIRLNGACLNRNLDCSSAKMLNRRGFSISAAGAIISGSAYFCAPKIWSGLPRCEARSVQKRAIAAFWRKNIWTSDAGRRAFYRNILCRTHGSHSTKNHRGPSITCSCGERNRSRRRPKFARFLRSRRCNIHKRKDQWRY